MLGTANGALRPLIRASLHCAVVLLIRAEKRAGHAAGPRYALLLPHKEAKRFPAVVFCADHLAAPPMTELLDEHTPITPRRRVLLESRHNVSRHDRLSVCGADECAVIYKCCTVRRSSSVDRLNLGSARFVHLALLPSFSLRLLALLRVSSNYCADLSCLRAGKVGRNSENLHHYARPQRDR